MELSSSSSLEIILVLLGLSLVNVIYKWWVLPNLINRKLKANGFSGPNPTFPSGNLKDINNPQRREFSSSSPVPVSNDIHSTLFPYFVTWQQSHGKVFVYWIGTAPFLYVAEPEFLKNMSANIQGKNWGKADVFKHDRKPLFGRSIVANEGLEWARRRHSLAPAFSPPHLKATARLMVESTTRMVNRWAELIASGQEEINVEEEVINAVGDLVAGASCSMSGKEGKQVLGKLRALQRILFNSKRYVGVPYGKFLNPKQTLRANKLGKEIDAILYSKIKERVMQEAAGDRVIGDVVGVLMDGLGEGERMKAFTEEEMVDECKGFFFTGYETTAMAVAWSLLVLAVHPEWQKQLREEIMEVVGDWSFTNVDVLFGLKKMGWVMNEVLRLYGTVPNVQRAARHDIQVDNSNFVIPNGTNIWIDIVSMHHDRDLWGEDVNEFKPERFENDIYGGCNHKMGFLPFGFGGRMCIGKNLTNLVYRVMLTRILSKFSFSLSPNYRHSPTLMLSLRPAQGIPLIFQNL